MLNIRDRIVELVRVPANSLRPNPLNWRTHPEAQRNAMRGALAELGLIDAVLARRLPDGSLELIDGHLRAEELKDAPVPVLVVDLDEAEAKLALATFDPLTKMAEASAETLDALLAGVTTGNAALQELIAATAEEAGLYDDQEDEAPEEQEVPSVYQVVVQCESESDQRETYERLRKDGFTCRVLTL